MIQPIVSPLSNVYMFAIFLATTVDILFYVMRFAYAYAIGPVSVVTISISKQLMVATVVCEKCNDQCTQRACININRAA